MYYYLFIRHPQTSEQREQGRRLGAELKRERHRKQIPVGALATEADIAVDTLRSIETGRIVSPSFFIVARLASRLGVSLDGLAERTGDSLRRGEH
jgi:transcriptional regulator with XRE-family HTH domain